MATVFTSKKPCALCKSTQMTFEAKVPDLQGILCARCLYERAGEKPPKKAAEPKADKKPEQK